MRLWNGGVSATAEWNPPSRVIVIPALGVTQILAWGSSYYLLAVLAKPIADDTGWPFAWVVGGLSLGLLTAGLVSPRVGDSIQHHGGRPVLAASAALLACGLIGLALAPALPVYLLSWLAVGAGMGAGLYDAAFSTLGRLYGAHARTAIATLTLFGGFASTICWPLSALFVSHLGWRGACLLYAGIQLLIALPLYLFLIPNEPKERGPIGVARERAQALDRPPSPAPGSRTVFILMASAITVSAMISTVVSVHLLTFLQLRDIALAAAVALGALIGPTQVAARAIEMLISRYHHPLWTMLAATLFVATGVGMLWLGFRIVAAALLFYGAGIGIESIARATVPLAVFGHARYAAIMGRIAMPSLLAQAAAPSLGAILMEHFGASATLGALFGAAVFNVLIVIVLFTLLRREDANLKPDAAVARRALRPGMSRAALMPSGADGGGPSVLSVFLIAAVYEVRPEPLGGVARHHRFGHFLKLKVDGVAGVGARRTDCRQQITLDARPGERCLRRIGRQGVAHRPRGTDDPAGKHAPVFTPIGGVENAFHDKMRMRGEDVDRLRLLDLEELLIDSKPRGFGSG